MQGSITTTFLWLIYYLRADKKSFPLSLCCLLGCVPRDHPTCCNGVLIFVSYYHDGPVHQGRWCGMVLMLPFSSAALVTDHLNMLVISNL